MKTKNELIEQREILYSTWKILPAPDEETDPIAKWNLEATEISISAQIDALDWVLEYNYEPEEEE